MRTENVSAEHIFTVPVTYVMVRQRQRQRNSQAKPTWRCTRASDVCACYSYLMVLDICCTTVSWASSRFVTTVDDHDDDEGGVLNATTWPQFLCAEWSGDARNTTGWVHANRRFSSAVYLPASWACTGNISLLYVAYVVYDIWWRTWRICFRCSCKCVRVCVCVSFRFHYNMKQ